MESNMLANIRRIADEVCETEADGDFLNAVASLLEGKDLEITITGSREPAIPCTGKIVVDTLFDAYLRVREEWDWKQHYGDVSGAESLRPTIDLLEDQLRKLCLKAASFEHVLDSAKCLLEQMTPDGACQADLYDSGHVERLETAIGAFTASASASTPAPCSPGNSSGG
jgi:hypothetical protein